MQVESVEVQSYRVGEEISRMWSASSGVILHHRTSSKKLRSPSTNISNLAAKCYANKQSVNYTRAFGDGPRNRRCSESTPEFSTSMPRQCGD
ncbi:hypothetical protein TNCV_3025221 [Trichonephila clavipes]|nr:hypothetical protein TNCV_3025221 [Trichonephila clavipes]